VLDEVAALSPTAQSKMLRVLQERAFERLGGTETLRIEARLIALTNVDLSAAVAAGTFREDLFFRLNVLTLNVPPLRERRVDVLALADLLLLLRTLHARPAAGGRGFAKVAAGVRLARNVRELRNALERAVVSHGPRYWSRKTSPTVFARPFPAWQEL
jgi:transcriptional regulator with GAF, ATPase, and Fis domain